MKCGKTCKFVSTITIAGIFLTVGLCAIFLWGTVYDNLLHSQLTITNHSKGYDMWKETPIPMYLNVYLFNWTNAEDVLHNWTIKPEFKECGPYVFSEHHVRVNLKWHDNGTVTYQQKRIWKYLPDHSNGSLQDNITNVNVIASTVAYIVRKKPVFVKDFVDYFIELKEKKLVLTKTADEWMFSGYDDELLELASKLKLKDFKIPFKKFGWFYGRNNSETYDGNFTMYTGTTDLELLGIMDSWNGSPVTKFYSDYCGYVNGTSGELWPPVNIYNKVSIFSPDTCSTLWLSHDNVSDEVLGLEGKTYVGTDFNFDNGTKYPEQSCFHYDRIFPSGIREVSQCKFGAPAFVSYPHFYLADPSYTNNIKGMYPNETKHKFYIVLEPNTGIPLEVNARVQINILIEPIKSLKMFENIKQTFVPTLWFTQSARLTPKYANQAKLLLMIPLIMTYTGFGLICIAAILVITILYIAHKNAWRDKEEVPLLNNDS